VPEERHVYAEIRPDSKVETGPPVQHWHGSSEEAPEDAYEPGVSILDYGSVAWEEHVKKVNEENKEKCEVTGEPFVDHALEEGVHEHPDEAKYVFPPDPMGDNPKTHNHHRGRAGRYYEKHPDHLAKHIADWHIKHPERTEWTVEWSEGDGHNYDAYHVHTRRKK
jgi:hypothetical protein